MKAWIDFDWEAGYSIYLESDHFFYGCVEADIPEELYEEYKAAVKTYSAIQERLAHIYEPLDAERRVREHKEWQERFAINEILK